MNSKQLLNIINLIEIQTCGILIENNICEYIKKPNTNKSEKHNNFNNMRLLEPYASQFGYSEIDDEFVKKIRSAYPKQSHRIGTIKVIKAKLIRFLNNNPQYTKEQILQVISSYSDDMEMKQNTAMMFSLDNIFYKKIGKIEKSPIESLINSYLNSPNLNSEPLDFTIDE